MEGVRNCKVDRGKSGGEAGGRGSGVEEKRRGVSLGQKWNASKREKQ